MRHAGVETSGHQDAAAAQLAKWRSLLHNVIQPALSSALKCPKTCCLRTILGKKSVRDIPGCTANTSTPVPCTPAVKGVWEGLRVGKAVAAPPSKTPRTPACDAAACGPAWRLHACCSRPAIPLRGRAPTPTPSACPPAATHMQALRKLFGSHELPQVGAAVPAGRGRGVCPPCSAPATATPPTENGSSRRLALKLCRGQHCATPCPHQLKSLFSTFAPLQGGVGTQAGAAGLGRPASCQQVSPALRNLCGRHLAAGWAGQGRCQRGNA